MLAKLYKVNLLAKEKVIEIFYFALKENQNVQIIPVNYFLLVFFLRSLCGSGSTV